MHWWCREKTYSYYPLLFSLFCLFRCVCNIDCSQTNFNPLCASDGKSYDNACQIKEASCQKQEKIEVMSLGRCQGNAHNKTHFKECFQFLLREEKKIKRELGLPSHLALLAFPLGCCNVYGAWCWGLFLICWAHEMPAVPGRKFC